MVKCAVIVIKAEEQGSDELAALRRLLAVTEAAHNAVGAAVIFDLLHAVAIARLIGEIEAFCDDAVASSAG